MNVLLSSVGGAAAHCPQHCRVLCFLFRTVQLVRLFSPRPPHICRCRCRRHQQNAPTNPQTLAWCLGGVGAFLVIRKAARQALRRWREHQVRERVRKALLSQHHQGDGSAAAAGADGSSWDLEAAGLVSSSSGAGHGHDGGRDQLGAGICVVCLSAPSEMVYVKCGHMCCCSNCVATMAGSRKCPVCRTEGGVIKVFRT